MSVDQTNVSSHGDLSLQTCFPRGDLTVFLAHVSISLCLSQCSWCQVPYSGGCHMSVEIAEVEGPHRCCVGQEGGQIEDRGYGLIHHHLGKEEKH